MKKYRALLLSISIASHTLHAEFDKPTIAAIAGLGISSAIASISWSFYKEYRNSTAILKKRKQTIESTATQNATIESNNGSTRINIPNTVMADLDQAERLTTTIKQSKGYERSSFNTALLSTTVAIGCAGYLAYRIAQSK